MSGFTGPIVPVKRTVAYRIGVLLVAGAVVLLPVLYVALIGVAGWGVYWHATENTEVATWGYGRGRILAVLVYLAPILAGSIAVLFMLKPLLARTVMEHGHVSLNRAAQPLLFTFVGKICDTVNAPRPSRIAVTFDVNASAGYGSGFLSLFKSDLVLTIGLPLVAGLSLKQLGGILAHEFGHFSQGAAMRVSWIVRTINFWFARVVYQRDEWDVWLIEAAEGVDLRVGWVFYVARFAVFISRSILWCLMTVSHMLSCWLSRQMEFDADKYEIRLVGTASFEETCFRLNWLNHGLNGFITNRMLKPPTGLESANPIRDFITHCETLDDADEKRVRDRIANGETALFDTHPSDSERIANAKKENADGKLKSELPAEALFTNFDGLCHSLLRL